MIENDSMIIKNQLTVRNCISNVATILALSQSHPLFQFKFHRQKDISFAHFTSLVIYANTHYVSTTIQGHVHPLMHEIYEREWASISPIDTLIFSLTQYFFTLIQKQTIYSTGKSITVSLSTLINNVFSDDSINTKTSRIQAVFFSHKVCDPKLIIFVK